MNRRDLLQALIVGPVAWPAAAQTAIRPEPRDILLLRTRLAGFGHHDGPKLRARLRPGQPLTQIREPTNPHDAHAVRIDWHGQPLGYLPRHQNQAPARLIDQRYELLALAHTLNAMNDSWRPIAMSLYLTSYKSAYS